MDLEKLKPLTIISALITIVNFSLALISEFKIYTTKLPLVQYLNSFNVDSIIIQLLIFTLLELIISYFFVKVMMKSIDVITKNTGEGVMNMEWFLLSIFVLIFDFIASGWTTIFNIGLIFDKPSLEGSASAAALATVLYSIAFYAENNRLDSSYESKYQAYVADKNNKKYWKRKEYDKMIYPYYFDSLSSLFIGFIINGSAIIIVYTLLTGK